MIQSDFKLIKNILKNENGTWGIYSTFWNYNRANLIQQTGLQEGWGGWGRGPGRTRTNQWISKTVSGLSIHYRLYWTGRSPKIRNVYYDSK